MLKFKRADTLEGLELNKQRCSEDASEDLRCGVAHKRTNSEPIHMVTILLILKYISIELNNSYCLTISFKQHLKLKKKHLI